MEATTQKMVRAAFPSSPTLQRTDMSPRHKRLKNGALGALRSFGRLEQDCHLLWCPFPGDFDAGLARMTELCNNATIPGAKMTRRGPPRILGLGLIPFHSQLLGESLLVSFPPLNYMLKFYGLILPDVRV